jgi:hypothetical protein
MEDFEDLGAYCARMREVYEAIKEKGFDVFIARGGLYNPIFGLPSATRPERRDGSVVLKDTDYPYLEGLLGQYPTEAIRARQLEVHQLTEPWNNENITLEKLEAVLKGGKAFANKGEIEIPVEDPS